MDFGELLPPRSVEDILAERVRIVIGGEAYDLPVMAIAENREWKRRMDRALGILVASISLTDDLSAVLDAFDGYDESLMDLLLSYDTTGVLPDRDAIEAGLTPLGLFRAVLEVWRAARPLADIARTGLSTDLPLPTSGPPINSWRRRMASWLQSTDGRPDTSSAN